MLFLPALVLFALGLLTVFRAPDWCPWKLALLAGEFGHWLALVALALVALAVGGLAAWQARSGGAWAGATLVLAAGAAGLLLKPAWQARDLDRLGAPAADRAAFALAGLLGRAPAEVRPETMVYAKGLALDFYRPVAPGPVPCVIVLHGGGWNSGARDQLPGFNAWLVQQGYAVAAVSYRLAPDCVWPGQRDDVLAALAFLKQHAGRLGLDPGRFALLGRSAGGQIAEAVAYAAHDPAIRALVAFYAPSDLRYAYRYAREDDALRSPELMRQFLGGTPETAGAAYASASALPLVTPAAPPTLLLHGEIDTLVWHRHSVRLEAALERVGVPCVLVSLPWATHAFEYNLAGPGGQIATYALRRFLAHTLR